LYNRQLFLLIGIGGVYIEIKTPGFGIPGITGIVFLSLFFFGHYIAGLAGKEELLLIILGIILLALEIFVIPGFGITGVTGILCIILGGFAMMLPIIPAEGFSGIANINQEYLEEALWKFTIFLLLFLTTIWLMAKLLPKTKLFSRLVLAETTAKGKTYSEPEQQSDNLLNQTGTTLSVLRPVGTASLNGQRTDVVSHGPVISAGVTIKVIKVVGSKIIVKPISTGEPHAE
jgi:membrane-bound serine protease (ClpP class)